MENELAAALAGRAAEEILGGSTDHYTIGATKDIEDATGIAKKMVRKWGMSEKIGPVCHGRKTSEQKRQEIEREVEALVKKAQCTATQTLRAHEPALHRLAEALLERKTLSYDEVVEIVQPCLPSGKQLTLELVA